MIDDSSYKNIKNNKWNVVQLEIFNYILEGFAFKALLHPLVDILAKKSQKLWRESSHLPLLLDPIYNNVIREQANLSSEVVS